jgi:hypothetical protein
MSRVVQKDRHAFAAQLRSRFGPSSPAWSASCSHACAKLSNVALSSIDPNLSAGRRQSSAYRLYRLESSLIWSCHVWGATPNILVALNAPHWRHAMTTPCTSPSLACINTVPHRPQVWLIVPELALRRGGAFVFVPPGGWATSLSRIRCRGMSLTQGPDAGILGRCGACIAPSA